MTISRFLTMSFALLVILTTTACQVTPPHPALPSKVTSAETGSDAPQLMRKAEQAGPDEAARLRLAAAEAFQSAGDTASATAALNATDPSRLDGARQFTFYNLRALLALDAHDYTAAKQAIGLAVPTNAAERNAYALTVADVAEAQQRFEDAALSLMGYTYSPRAVDTAQFAAIVERTWADVNRTSAYRISALAKSQQSAVSEAWWQLADSLQRSFDLDAERAAISEWRGAHPEHPAARWPPRALTLIEGNLSAPSHIALLLPLTGPLANAGQAVRDGFIAAFYHAASKTTIRIYDTDSSDNTNNHEPIAGLYEQACSDGAQLIIGPLDKQRVTEINALPYRQVPVLALNYLPSGIKAGTGLFQFGLAIEDEARAIARRVYADALPRVAIVESDDDWSDRAADSFRSQFLTLGGTVVATGIIQDARDVTSVVGNVLLVGASTRRFEALSKTIGTTPEFTARRRSDIDALVALADPPQARVLNSAMAFQFAGDIPIYATSQSVASLSPAELRDLTGIRVTEPPWRVYASPIHDEVEAAFSNARSSLSPLYALGIDAFRLGDRADLLMTNSPARLLGETGQLQVQSSGVVTREPVWAIVQNGMLVAMPTVVD